MTEGWEHQDVFCVNSTKSSSRSATRRPAAALSGKAALWKAAPNIVQRSLERTKRGGAAKPLKEDHIFSPTDNKEKIFFFLWQNIPHTNLEG
jgi:hypothetical protein